MKTSPSRGSVRWARSRRRPPPLNLSRTLAPARSVEPALAGEIVRVVRGEPVALVVKPAARLLLHLDVVGARTVRDQGPAGVRRGRDGHQRDHEPYEGEDHDAGGQPIAVTAAGLGPGGFGGGRPSSGSQRSPSQNMHTPPFGNPADSGSPVALRPRLATGVLFRGWVDPNPAVEVEDVAHPRTTPRDHGTGDPAEGPDLTTLHRPAAHPLRPTRGRTPAITRCRDAPRCVRATWLARRPGRVRRRAGARDDRCAHDRPGARSGRVPGERPPLPIGACRAGEAADAGSARGRSCRTGRPRPAARGAGTRSMSVPPGASSTANPPVKSLQVGHVRETLLATIEVGGPVRRPRARRGGSTPKNTATVGTPRARPPQPRSRRGVDARAPALHGPPSSAAGSRHCWRSRSRGCGGQGRGARP